MESISHHSPENCFLLRILIIILEAVLLRFYQLESQTKSLWIDSSHAEWAKTCKPNSKQSPKRTKKNSNTTTVVSLTISDSTVIKQIQMLIIKMVRLTMAVASTEEQALLINPILA
jgi:uncharacterized protein (UPF0333 family)